MAKQPGDSCTGAVPFYGNKYIQFGSLDPWTGEATDESEASIRTNLTTVECAMATIDDTYGLAIGTDAAANTYLEIERVVSSGAVTISRTTSAAALGGQSFSYLMIGTQDDTN